MCIVYYVTSPKATISRILTEDNDLFHEEKSEIFLSGLNSTTYQQIDDTSARVNENNWYTQIICNPYYAAYFLSLIHISEPTRLLSISYAVFCLKKKKKTNHTNNNH